VLLFRLHLNKNANVYHSSAASLRQVITMLFDRTVAEYLLFHLFLHLLRPLPLTMLGYREEAPRDAPAGSTEGTNSQVDETASATPNGLPPSLLSSVLIILRIHQTLVHQASLRHLLRWEWALW
jgi:hypothetical protein